MKIKNIHEIAENLHVSERRIRQLVESNVLLTDNDDQIDPVQARQRYDILTRREPSEISRLVNQLETISSAAITAADALTSRSSLTAAREAAALAREFDELGSLIEAMRPESERALLAHARSSFVGSIFSKTMAVAERHEKPAA